MRKTAYQVGLGVWLLVATADLASAVCGVTENYGRVQRIYPISGTAPGTYFQLVPGRTDALTNPDGYYVISALPAVNAAAQSVYRSMHDLLVEAAKAGWTVHARTHNCTAPASQARVLYLVVDP
jgi:hypothetical protein